MDHVWLLMLWPETRRIVLTQHLRTLAKVTREAHLDVETSWGPAITSAFPSNENDFHFHIDSRRATALLSRCDLKRIETEESALREQRALRGCAVQLEVRNNAPPL